MDVFLIGSEGSERLARFQQTARARGLHVHQGRPEKATIGTGQPRNSIVLFQDGQANPVDSVAALRDEFRYLGVVLAGVGAPELSGADIVFDSATPDEEILDQLESRCQVQRVPPELQEVVDAFIFAVGLTLREWATSDVILCTAYRKAMHKAFGEVTAVLALTPASAGTMALAFRQQTAATLAGRILTQSAEDLDRDIIHDCLREIINIVAGQAKALLAGTPRHFAFSTPIGVSGLDAEVGVPPDSDCLVVVFDSDAGEFALQLFLPRS